MSKLIFNPKKDMKELEKYGFVNDKYNENYILNVSKLEHGLDGIVINYDGTVDNYTSSKDETILIFYNLIKADLIVDDEELKED
ncbi:MAG: hypothetical protein NC483_00685 [Ruminococcus sp.]|nr:hypothetical protein [Ruminococcus sp.]